MFMYKKGWPNTKRKDKHAKLMRQNLPALSYLINKKRTPPVVVSAVTWGNTATNWEALNINYEDFS